MRPPLDRASLPASVIWGLFMLLSVMCFVLSGFSLYHTYLVALNSTTNERSKLAWMASGINVHAYHQIRQLSPIYERKQEELRAINAIIVETAYREAAEKRLTGGEAVAYSSPSPPAVVAPTGVDTAAAGGASAADSAAASAVSSYVTAPGFPPGPYSAELSARMHTYHFKKAEVYEIYAQLQHLEAQGFLAPHILALLPTSGGEGASASAPLTSVGEVEPTDGCVPTGIGASLTAAASTHSKPAPHVNPYSRGFIANVREVILPLHMQTVSASDSRPSATRPTQVKAKKRR
jgi:hypothetical protein